MKPRTLVNCALLVLSALSFGLHFLLRPAATERNYEVMYEMAHSKAYESLSENPNFPDGKTQQEPPQGTIPKGFAPFRFGPSPEEAARAGDETASPLPLGDPSVLKRGEVVYSTFCVVCHGAAGLGDGPIGRRGFPPPPSFLAQKAMGMKDGQIFHVLTRGQGNMPSYAAQVSPRDRWAAVAFVRALQRKETAK